MCNCLDLLPKPYRAGFLPGDVEVCPSCGRDYKIRERRSGTFRTREWVMVPRWDLLARFRAAILHVTERS